MLSQAFFNSGLVIRDLIDIRACHSDFTERSSAVGLAVTVVRNARHRQTLII